MKFSSILYSILTIGRNEYHLLELSFSRAHAEPGKSGNRSFLRKIRENLEYSGNFLQFLFKSGNTDYLLHTLFSSSLCIAVRKVVVLFVVSKCKLYLFA